MTAIAKQNAVAVLEDVLIKGDISQLTPEQRIEYYKKICDISGLNPVSQPFEYLVLNNRTVLYAKKSCTDQLRFIHKISVVELQESEREGVFIVTCKVSNADNRTDIAKGAVRIEGLKGDALANAIMKAETKAKRRATLSICGLGILDESELDTIPANAMETPSAKPHFKNAALRNSFISSVIKEFEGAATLDELEEFLSLRQPIIDQMKASGNEHDELGVQELRNRYMVIKKGFTKKEDIAASYGEGFADIEDYEEVPSFLGKGAA